MNNIKKVYICTPLKPEKFQLDSIQRAVLGERVFAFIPPTEEKNNKYQGSMTDRLMIDLCDELWAFGPIGRDCSWEIGYAQGLGKPVRLYADQTNKDIIENDWMLFCAGTKIKKVSEL